MIIRTDVETQRGRRLCATREARKLDLRIWASLRGRRDLMRALVMTRKGGVK